MIEEIANEYGMEIPELQKVEADLKKRYAAIDVPALKGDETQFIKKGLISYAKKIKAQKAEQFYGTVLTCGKVSSSNNRKIEDALKQYKINPDESIQKGFIAEIKKDPNVQSYIVRKLDEKTNSVKRSTILKLPENVINSGDGETYLVALDSRRVWTGSGKKNFNFLKPLNPAAYFTNVGGLVVVDGEIHNWSMTVNLKAAEFTVPMYCPIKFRAPVIKVTNGNYSLAFKDGLTAFEKTEGDIAYLRNKIVEYLPIIEVDEIETIHKGDWGVPVAVAGTVTDLWIGEPSFDKPTPQNTIVIDDIKTGTSLRINVHRGVPIDFGIGSVVIIWGNTSKGKGWDREARQQTEDIVYGVFATGAYPIVKVGPEEKPAEVLPQTENNDGWKED